MDPAYQEIIRRRLELPLHEGPDKTATLEDAVRRHVEPGDTLYVGTAHGRANAAVREIARQWLGKTPGFTLAAVGIGSPWTALVHGNLVRRTITTFMGEGYPFPTPQALISRAVLEGRLEVQNWSMLTFPLRLLAGAMSVPFLPTKSLLSFSHSSVCYSSQLASAAFRQDSSRQWRSLERGRVNLSRGLGRRGGRDEPTAGPDKGIVTHLHPGGDLRFETRWPEASCALTRARGRAVRGRAPLPPSRIPEQLTVSVRRRHRSSRLT